MARKLPWLKGPRTTTGQSVRTVGSVTRRAKRHRLLEASSDMDDVVGNDLKRLKSPETRASPSETLQPLAESPMIEGLDHDDMFRMVEDEFLDAAKQFTQHLHAAEYQRMKKIAKSQNVATVNSISRPVTVKMPDETQRKVASIARSRKQATALQSLLSKQSGPGSDNESDDKESAWLGTTLHGLMESPRRSTTTLNHIVKITARTKAAAGFNKHQQRQSVNEYMPSSMQSVMDEPKLERLTYQERSATDLTDDDDDLDAPMWSRGPPKPLNATRVIDEPGAIAAQNYSINTVSHRPEGVTRASTFDHKYDEELELPVAVSKIARERIARRLEQTKLRDSKKDRKLDIIPTFLS